MKSFEDIIDEIIANMDKQRENARIKAFVTDISMMLRENGVIPCMSEVSAEIDDDDALKTVFCCQLEKLDFTEHDKVFEDKIAKLEKENKALNSYLVQREQDSTDMIAEQGDEISMLKSLIDNYRDAESKLFDENKELKQRIAELERELEKKECIKTMRIEFHADNGEMLTPLEVANSLITQNTFKVDELKELAEILEVYYRHHRDKNQDLDDLW